MAPKRCKNLRCFGAISYAKTGARRGCCHVALSSHTETQPTNAGLSHPSEACGIVGLGFGAIVNPGPAQRAEGHSSPRRWCAKAQNIDSHGI